MERKGIISKWEVICITSIIFLLILTLHQDSVFSTSTFTFIGSWQQSLQIGRRSDVSPEEAQLMEQHLKRLVRGKDQSELESTGLSCISDEHFEEFVVNKPVIFDKRSLTMYVASEKSNLPMTRITKPYARRSDQGAMILVSPLQMVMQGNISNINPPECQFRHNAPALVFSFGGFSHNFFHAFNDIIIPLFITSRHFEGKVQFVVTDYQRRQVRMFSQVLKKLTDYDFVDADADETVHCFPAAVVGLRYHGNLAVNSSETPGGHTMEDFRQFLRDSYNLKTKANTPLKQKKPKLLLLSRQTSRKLLNEDEMVNIMETLGFQVQTAMDNEMSDLDKFSHTVNSCDVLVGVHGAGLTNQLFLPNGSVVVQIVPLGIEWVSEHYFAKPAVNMGLKYLEYKVWPNETTLYDLYGPNDPVISDPASVWDKGYSIVQDVYFNHQDLRINLVRFKETLLEVLKLVG